MHGTPFIGMQPPITPTWVRTVAGDPLAIDLNTVKDWLNRPREDSFWDTQISGFTRTAQLAIETLCQMVLVPSTWVGSFPSIPSSVFFASTAQFYNTVRINKRPFQAVTEIDYVDPTTGVITVLDPTTYFATPIAQLCGQVYLGDGFQWPAMAYRQDAVRITVTAGFPNPLPDDIAHALLITIAAIDSRRGDETGSGGRVSVYEQKNSHGASIVPAEAQALLRDYRLRRI